MDTLSGMKAIQEYCRAINLPASEATVIQMIRESGFPAKKLGGIWVASKEVIENWIKEYTSGDVQTPPPKKTKKSAPKRW